MLPKLNGNKLRFYFFYSERTYYTIDCKRVCVFLDISKFFFWKNNNNEQFQTTITSTFDRINVKIILIKNYNDDIMKLQHSYNDIVNIIIVLCFTFT